MATTKKSRAASAKRGLLKAEFSEEAVKAVFVSMSAGDAERSGPGNQPSPDGTKPAAIRQAHGPRAL
jgi:hypothetical protein